MKKVLIMVAVIIFVAVAYTFYKGEETTVRDYKDATFVIEGTPVTLVDGVAEESIDASTSSVVTRYFGNELRTDLDGDGLEDFVFLVTQTRGGTGTFYYAVAAVDMGDSYIGSDGYLLGDRIAPQTTNISQNPRHKNVIVVNYADRGAGEAMTEQPSVGKSAYLKLDRQTMRWGIVEPDFEGESR